MPDTDSTPYTPTDEDMRWALTAQALVTPEAWERYIARVRRDAAREALDGLATTYRDVSAVGILQYRDAHYTGA